MNKFMAILLKGIKKNNSDVKNYSQILTNIYRLDNDIRDMTPENFMVWFLKNFKETKN